MGASTESPLPSDATGPGDDDRMRSDAPTEADADKGQTPQLDSTEPYQQPPERGEETLRHVRLDQARWPASIGRVGHYEVFAVVGQGAMGVVVRAFDTQLSRTVAIKLMSPQLMSSPQARERFFREARAAAGINHPNIVTIHAVSEHAGVPFLVMEFVGGRTLMDRIRCDAPLNPVDILRISAQIASGLAAAHKQGIIHRDIKPANIMLEDSVERVKVTDFGLARVMIEQSDLTSQGGVVGTPAYMSPEQVNGEPLDARSDLFSLGCVMYAMTAGFSPFRGENAMAAARRVAGVKHVSLANVSRDVPIYFIQIVDRLLAKSPADRFQSAEELLDELTRHLANLNRGADSKTHGTSTANDRRRRMRWLVASVLSLVVAVATLALLWDRHVSRKENVPVLGLATLETEKPHVLRVAKDGTADFTGLAAAIRSAGPGSAIRVEDAAIYSEPLSLIGAARFSDVRVEATAGATLKAPADRPVVTVDGAPRVTISGFQIEAAAGQHAIELRGSCPGVLVENCQINCAPDSPVAAVYLHAGASGTTSDPVLLRRLVIKSGGVGIVMGAKEDSEPVSHVRLTDSLIQGPSREYGVAIVLQYGVRQVSVRHNIFSIGLGGISLLFEVADTAADVLISENSLGNLHYSVTLGESSPEQGIRCSDNLIVETDTFQVGAPGIGAYQSWFQGNLWERSAGLDEALAGGIARLADPLSLISRDPESREYLKPAAAAGPLPGRYSTQPVQKKSN
jgi:eukaryotic-like serine/threonine-protein kinase